ncbi:39S ribosomal protein L22, mitochondrial [Coemansia thaxteri]|uniref:39S ribosomal protein L22, mitochondrial n=1 Tax=Coemansia thaxteri TaxID=2663907 RepID=A0A9W8BHI7_9FUNG|nr:39S ribosomal protein L22, mitochondrial [Coemansia thaxteri]KAJ2485109.1 39S ribosomal protein L22, mitochondrial [Coemansia sp. RSA 2320]
MQEDSKSWSAADQSASSAFTAEESDIAEDFKTVSGGRGKGTIRVREYTYSTANFHASPRKLRMIGNQISGLPVTEAIRQMQFSAKKAADKIKHSLVWARKNAVFQKQMNPDNMFVKLARVGKGQFRKRLDPKARGRHGIIRIPSAHMKYVLWEKRPEEAAVGRNAEERALLAGGNKLPRRNVKGFQLYKKVWTPLNETKPVMNAPGYYNW